MSVVETKNKEIIYKLIKNHFDFTKDSLELFKFRLFGNPNIGKEYLDIIGDNVDLRRYYELNDDVMEAMDEAWDSFKGIFKTFVSENNITYSQFKKNNYLVDGQILKAGKALSKFYLNSEFPNRLIFDFYNQLDEIVADILFYNHPIIRKNIVFIRSIAKSETDESKLHISYRSHSRTYSPASLKSISLKLNENKLEEMFKNISINFNDFVNETMERIGTKKIPNKKLYLVLSCNFADWFLCSTAESWDSCLNLESSTNACYWAGLPSLIGDKNRALIYITDGVKKNYRGIEVDRIITRSWLLTMRRNKAKNSQTEITFVNAYPSEIDLINIASKIIGINIVHPQAQEEETYRSRYYFELFFHNYNKESKVVSGIFLDTTEMFIAKKNKGEIRPHTYGYYKLGRGKSFIKISKKGKASSDDGDDTFFMSEQYDKDDEEICGLKALIAQEKTLADYREEQDID